MLMKSEQVYGQNNFGDLLGGCETRVDVGTGEFSPLERIVLSANGNLQRIMSAYFGLSVKVNILKCDKIGAMEYDREVTLEVDNKVFCTAVGKITLLDEECIDAIESKNIGVGQLFRYLGLLPSFELLEAGRTEDGALWRRYTLSSTKLACEFKETFNKEFLLP
jgi:chorismate-pyruvate lyase